MFSSISESVKNPDRTQVFLTRKRPFLCLDETSLAINPKNSLRVTIRKCALEAPCRKLKAEEELVRNRRSWEEGKVLAWRTFTKPKTLEGTYQRVVEAPIDEQFHSFVYDCPVSLVRPELRVNALKGGEILN